jgi:hypothetical protein
MFKLGPAASLHLLRVRRYLSTLISLWANPIRLRPVSEFVIIFGGLIAKLAPLVAFILTIQFAVWLISPERAPDRLHEMLGYATDPIWFHAAIISIPIGVFLIGSVAQKLSDHLSIQVRRKTAYTLVEASVPDRLTEIAESPSEIPKFFQEIRSDYQTIHRSVNSANNILNSLATVIIAGLIGFFIAPYFVVILLGGLSILGAGFVAWRHGETNRLLEQKQVALNEEIALQKATQQRLQQDAKEMTSDQKQALLQSFLANAVGNPNELDDRFRSNTNLASIFAPLVGVTALLGFLAGESEVTEERAAQLVMLVLVLRFCIGNLQSVITAMIGITRDYARLTKIFDRETAVGKGCVVDVVKDDAR